MIRNIVSGNGYCAKHHPETPESKKGNAESESKKTEEEDWFEPYILRSATVLVARGT